MRSERLGGARPFRDSKTYTRILKWILEWMSKHWSEAKIRKMSSCLRMCVLYHMETDDGGPTQPHIPYINISS